MDEIKAGFAKRLKRAIKASRKSMNQISMSCGISRNGLTYYVNENSERMPGGYNLALLCKELNVSADWLLFGKGEEPDCKIIEEES